jgi:2'-5' RNA ligase
VSLRFIGEVSEDQATALAAELEKGIALRPFDVEWGRVGTFPGGRAPRVVWIGATAGAAALVTLASMVAVRLDPIIGSSDSRPFKPHVTICRVRVPGRVDWPNILSSVKFEPTITRVDHVTLYRSRLSPQGPTYTQLTRIALV